MSLKNTVLSWSIFRWYIEFKYLLKCNLQKDSSINKIFDKSNDNQELEKLFDVLTAPHLKAAARDKTNTFKKMDELEFRDSIRAHAYYVKQSFFEDNNFAGSKEHQQKCYEMAVKLFAS